MTILRTTLAALLSICLAVEPAVAGVLRSVRVSMTAAPAAGAFAAQTPLHANFLGQPPSASFLSNRAVPYEAAAAASPGPASRAEFSRRRVSPIQDAAAQAIQDLTSDDGDASSLQAAVQFSALTGERLIAHDGAVPEPSARPLENAGEPAGSNLSKSTWRLLVENGGQAEPPAPATGPTEVFKDPARNRAFWRYTTGYGVFLVGYHMYAVGMPYLISSITRNSLSDNHDARAGNEEAVKTLIRSNRSLARIAHWTAQALSYVAIPLFTRDTLQDGAQKWWVRSHYIRAGVLALIPVLFFSTGLLSLKAMLFILLGLIAVQSFFQGISVTTEASVTTRIFGDRSVTDAERTKANSYLTILGAILAIIVPAIAGQLSLIGPILGKDGVGGALIYGIYAIAVAGSAFIYAGIKLLGGQAAAAPANAETPATAPSTEAPNGMGGMFKTLWASIKDGTKIILKNRFLRTLLILSLVSSLFTDPMLFNVIPDYIEGVVKDNPGSIGAIVDVPILGWLLKSLISSPMGNFALMVFMLNLGSMAAAVLIKPVAKLLDRLGFKTEEARTIPFFFLAALEAPLFLLMISTHSIMGVVLLYGLQALTAGFIAISVSGLTQKNLGDKGKDVNKILAAQSLLSTAAAIISTAVYGFALKGISISTSMTIAGVAISVMALLRLAAPFLAFSKEQRRPPEAPPTKPGALHIAPPRDAHPTPRRHGPNPIASAHRL